MIMEVINCHSDLLSSYLVIVKRIMLLIQLVFPILLILSATIQFTKLLHNPDTKGGTKRVVHSFLAAFVIFAIPILVNVLMNIIGANTHFSSCWLEAEEKLSFGNYQYINQNNQSKKGLINDPDAYEKADPVPMEDRSKNKTSSNTKNVIFLGDSRFSQMYAYLTGDWAGSDYSRGGAHVLSNHDVFISESGMGLDWMKSTGIPAAQAYFSSGSILIIEMGINDVGNVNSYVQYVNQNVNSWTSKGVKVYYTSIVPLQGERAVYNSSVSYFNTTLKNGLSSSVTWIDVAGYLGSSFVTKDGVHFDESTSNKIYYYIKSKV